MTETIATLLPIAQLFAAPTGAGVLASWLFDQLRAEWPLPEGDTHWAYKLLYAPAYARITTLVLAGLISIIASVAVAVLARQDVLPAVDVALAAAIGAIAGQLMHGLGLSTEVRRPI